MDESQNIRNIKKILKVQNTLIDFNEIYIHDSLKDLTDHFDEPIVDPNNYSLMSLCKHIKNLTDIKVVLCGEGQTNYLEGILDIDRYQMNLEIIQKINLF